MQFISTNFAMHALNCGNARMLLQLYNRAARGRGGGGATADGGESGDSARGGRKTPRDEVRDQSTSPNERLRKQARSSGGCEAPAVPRGVEDVTTQELERGISLESAAAEVGWQRWELEGLAAALRGPVLSLQRSCRMVSLSTCLGSGAGYHLHLLQMPCTAAWWRACRHSALHLVSAT
jgi:hypothetical protein